MKVKNDHRSLNVALYLQYLVETSQCASAISSAFYSLNWAYRLAGLPSPAENAFVIPVRDGAIRLLSRAKDGSHRKEPLDVEFLKRACAQADLDKLLDLRNILTFVLSFASFLRSSEVLGLKSGDLELSESFVSLTIHESRTDQLRDGNSVIISEVKDSMICPVSLLKK